MTSLKIVLTQLDQLPESDLKKNINALLYPIRRPMCLEAGKDEPNVTMIHTLKDLNDIIAAMASERVHALADTAMFVYGCGEDTKPKEDADAARRQSAKRKLMALIQDGRARPPKSKAEMDAMIAVELEKEANTYVDNFNKATSAVEMIDSITDGNLDGEYDESELPEYVIEGITAKVIDVCTAIFKDADRRLSRCKYAFQRTGPEAARVGALTVLKHFGVEQAEVITVLEKARKTTEELFARLEGELGTTEEKVDETAVPTIDNPPADTTTKSKKTVYKNAKAKQPV